MCRDLHLLLLILGPYHCCLRCTAAYTDWAELTSRGFSPCVARRRKGLVLNLSIPHLFLGSSQADSSFHSRMTASPTAVNGQFKTKNERLFHSPVQMKNILQAIKSRWIFQCFALISCQSSHDFVTDAIVGRMVKYSDKGYKLQTCCCWVASGTLMIQEGNLNFQN